MALAMVYPKGTQGKKTATSIVAARQEVGAGKLSHARTVLAESRGAADDQFMQQGSKQFAEQLKPTTALTTYTFSRVG